MPALVVIKRVPIADLKKSNSDLKESSFAVLSFRSVFQLSELYLTSLCFLNQMKKVLPWITEIIVLCRQRRPLGWGRRPE